MSNERRIPSHGPKDCSIALVGESPGPDEDKYGIAPFVGWSGKLISNDIFAKAKIKRHIEEVFVPGRGVRIDIDSEVYTTNVIKYFPGRDMFEKRFYERGNIRRPTVELINAWDELGAELGDTSAKVILAAGNHALKALTKKWGIQNWRGSILEATLQPIAGRKVIPIIHPAHILRDYYWRTLTILDCKRAKAQSAFPEIRRPERTYVIRPTLKQILEVEERLYSSEYISLDIETKGNHIACVGFAPNAQWGLCIPFIAGPGHYWESQYEERRAWEAVYRICTGPSKKILQNALFDMSHLAAHGIHVKNLWMDTMLAMNVLYPELQKSLAVLCSIYTEEPYYKAEGRKAMKAKGDIGEKAWDHRQSDEELWRYNLKDCMVTYEVAMEELIDIREACQIGEVPRVAA